LAGRWMFQTRVLVQLLAVMWLLMVVAMGMAMGI
jgi:hypothetical protein